MAITDIINMVEQIINIERIFSEPNVEIMSVRWSQDDSILSFGCSDGTIKIYSDGGFLRSLNCQREMPVTSMRWKPAGGKTKNILLNTTCDGGVFQWHASSGKLMHHDTIEENQAYSCEYKPDATAYAIGCKDNVVRVFDDSSKSIITQLGSSRLYSLGHSSRVFSLKWVDETMLISGGWDNKIICWDLRTPTVIREIYGPHICGDSIDVKNNLILTGSYNKSNQLQLWNLADGRNIYSSSLKSGNKDCLVYTAQFGKISNTMAIGGSGSDESYFYSTDPVAPLAVVANLTKPVYSIDFCNNSNRAAIGCGDGTVVICNLKIT